jgi:hypothetical protein
MSRKHFRLIAAAIAAQVPTVGHSAALQIAAALADDFAYENPRFDRQRFLRACGVL